MSARLESESLSDYISKLFMRRTSENGVFGFKAHLNQYIFLHDLSQHFHYFQSLKYIYIYRDDIVAQAVSRLIARQTQEWTSQHGKLGEAVYDSSAIRNCIDELKRFKSNWQQSFRNLGIEPFLVRYETFVEAPDKTVADICAFLNVDPADPASPVTLPSIERQNDLIKAEWIARYRAENG